jgi:hypothetical protein
MAVQLLKNWRRFTMVKSTFTAIGREAVPVSAMPSPFSQAGRSIACDYGIAVPASLGERIPGRFQPATHTAAWAGKGMQKKCTQSANEHAREAVVFSPC